jgi:hypothetical protein
MATARIAAASEVFGGACRVGNECRGGTGSMNPMSDQRSVDVCNRSGPRCEPVPGIPIHVAGERLVEREVVHQGLVDHHAGARHRIAPGQQAMPDGRSREHEGSAKRASHQRALDAKHRRHRPFAAIVELDVVTGGKQHVRGGGKCGGHRRGVLRCIFVVLMTQRHQRRPCTLECKIPVGCDAFSLRVHRISRAVCSRCFRKPFVGGRCRYGQRHARANLRRQ